MEVMADVLPPMQLMADVYGAYGSWCASKALFPTGWLKAGVPRKMQLGIVIRTPVYVEAAQDLLYRKSS